MTSASSKAAGRPGESRPWAGRLGIGRLDRYLLRQLAAPMAVSLGLILSALLLDKALRLVAALSESEGRLGFLVPLMAALTPYYLDTALPFAFFAAILIAVAALDERGEIEAILAAGVSPDRLAWPFVLAGVGVSVAVLAVSGWPEPLGRFDFSKGQAEAVQAGWSGRLEPGVVFTPQAGTSLEADQVLVLGHQLRHVFQDKRTPSGEETVTTAREGRWSLVHGGREVALVLRDGAVFRDRPSGATFGRFAVLEETEPAGMVAARPSRGGDERELTLPELAGARRSAGARGRVVTAELVVKLAQALVIPFLPLFAIPLALASKRGGRAPGIILAVACLAAFHNALQFAKGLVVNGRLSSSWPIVLTAGGFALLCLAVHLSSRRRPGDNPITQAVALFTDLAAKLRRRLAPLLRGMERWRTHAGIPAYVAWLCGTRTVFAGLGLITFFQIADLKEMAPKILARGLGAAGLLHFETLRLPALTLQLGGLAILIGAVSTFSALGNRSESVAMQACGMSPYRILLAAAPVALFMAVLEFSLASEVAPHTQAALDGWWNRTAPAPERPGPRSRWLRVGGDLLYADSVAGDGRRLQGVRFYFRDPAGLLQARMSAPGLAWANGWRAQTTRVDRLSVDGETANPIGPVRWTGLALTPSDLRAVKRTPDETPLLTAAWTNVSGAPTDKRRRDLATRVQHSLAESLGPLVMLLLASPVLIAAGGRRPQAPPLGLAFGSGLAFLMADGFFTALGEAGDLPAFVAAWGAPAVFALGGVFALSYSEG